MASHSAKAEKLIHIYCMSVVIGMLEVRKLLKCIPEVYKDDIVTMVDRIAAAADRIRTERVTVKKLELFHICGGRGKFGVCGLGLSGSWLFIYCYDVGLSHVCCASGHVQQFH